MVKHAKNKLKTKLTKKFRLVVLNEDSFEERFSFKLTRLNVFVLGGVFSIVLVALTVLLIAFTPIKEYIPGFSSTKLKKQATDLFYKVDSLQMHLNTIEKYTNAMKPILIGEEKDMEIDLPYQKKPVEKEIALVGKAINSDSIRKVVENIRQSLDSTWKAHYEHISKESVAIQQKKYDSLKLYVVDTLKISEEKQKQELLALTEINEKMKLDLVKNKKVISDLKNSISMKNTEVQNLINSLSKENKDDLLKNKKTAEKQKQELLALTAINEKMKLDLVKNKKEISDLKNSISMKNTEVQNLINSFSKENQDDLLKNKKTTAKLQQEIEKRERAIYNERELKLTSSFDKERKILNQSLFEKDAVIDSLLFKITDNQQKTIGEINQLKTEVLSVKDSLLIQRSLRDSIFRESVEREDRYSLFDFETNKVDVVFMAPVKGIITEEYNVKEKHYAVDVAVAKGTAVKAIADGTVVFAEWTAETGYVVIIEHINKYLSVYKHNEIIYRKQGDLVQTGEVISMAGSSGEYSTGPHLHFEMWYEGYPVNPTNFIEFE